MAVSVLSHAVQSSDTETSVFDHPWVEQVVRIGGESVRWAGAGAIVVLANDLVRKGATQVGLVNIMNNLDTLLDGVEGARWGLGIGAVLMAKNFVIDPVADQLGIPGTHIKIW